MDNGKVSSEDMQNWYRMSKELKELKVSEMALRKRLFDHYFKDPKEGANRVDIEGGYELVGTFGLTRNIDKGVLSAISKELTKASVSVDALVGLNPVLIKKEYNLLTASQRDVFDQALIINLKSPSLMIRKITKKR